VRERKWFRFGEFLRDYQQSKAQFKNELGFELSDVRKLVGYDEKDALRLTTLKSDVEKAKISNNGFPDKPLLRKSQEALDQVSDEMANKLRSAMIANKEKLSEIYQIAKARVVRGCFQKLVDEIRGSQIFVDKSGIPTIRKKAKTSLRKIDV